MKTSRMLLSILIATQCLTSCYRNVNEENIDKSSIVVSNDQTVISSNETTSTTQLSMNEIADDSVKVSDNCLNAKYSDYKQAFKQIANYYDRKYMKKESESKMRFRLIYFNNDEIPELVAGINGYWVTVFQYVDGYVYPIIDHWPYGAFGNGGYEFYEKTGVTMNFEQNGAGAEHYIIYSKLNEATHTMEDVCYYHEINDTSSDYDFSDPGYFKYIDENEVEINSSEYNSLIEGFGITPDSETNYLQGEMTLDEFLEALGCG
ncbi:MAG: hypothetical protein K6G84_03610 [Lachnospiraceae bacterium]|nr:hypothetical protein [Lachnospiraceae bacterium]